MCSTEAILLLCVCTRAQVQAQVLWVNAHIRVCAFWVCTHGGQRAISNVILQKMSTFVFETGLGLTNLETLACLLTSWILLPLSPQHRETPAHAAIITIAIITTTIWVLGVKLSFLCLSGRSFFEMLTIFLRCVYGVVNENPEKQAVSAETNENSNDVDRLECCGSRANYLILSSFSTLNKSLLVHSCVGTSILWLTD